MTSLVLVGLLLADDHREERRFPAPFGPIIPTKSCGVLRDMNRSGTDIQSVHSYDTADKVYCVYNAPSEEAVRQHAQCGGFPAKPHSARARDHRPDNGGVGILVVGVRRS